MSESSDKWASVGDTIETVGTVGILGVFVSGELRGRLTATLDTPEACAYGNELIASGRWRKVSKPEKGE